MALLIVLDFDGTITEEDTVDSLARFAVYYAPTDSRATTPTQDWPNSPAFSLPSPELSASIGELVGDKVVFRLEPATADKPSPAEEKELAVRVDETIISEPTPEPSPSIPGATESFDDSTLPTAPQPLSPSLASVKSFSGLTLSTSSILSPTPSFISSTSLLDMWNFTLVEGYKRDIQKFESEYTPSEDARLTWEDEEEFLEQLNAVELESMKRVECTPLFRNLKDDDFRKFGQEAVKIGLAESETRPLVNSRPGPRGVELRPVKLRKGFTDFVSQASLKQWQLGLVSINWSQAFIEGVLAASDENSGLSDGSVDEGVDEDISRNTNNDNKNGSYPSTKKDIDENITRNANNGNNNGSCPSTETGLNDNKNDDLARLLGDLRLDSTLGKFACIMANNINSNGNIDGPSTWERPIITAKDKETAFGQLKDEVGGWNKSAYIGDSRTDILCLREADLGIAMATDPDRSGLLKTLRRLTGDVPHVSKAIMNPGTKLAWARNFEEIVQSEILKGLSK